MAITAEFVIRSPTLPLTDLAASVPSSRIECEHGLCLKRDCDVFVTRFDSSDDVSEDDLAACGEVVEITSLGRTNDRDVYRLTIELDETVLEAFAPERFTAVEVEPMIVTPEGWCEKQIFETCEEFNRLRTRFEEYDIAIELVSITQEVRSADDPPQRGLTDRQYEALTLAIRRGYYQNLRQSTAEELAEEMGITQSSMSSLLRRGERQLLSWTLEPQDRLHTSPS